ncbi:MULTISPECIES: hypothetical protein [unclassified Microcoleus]|uniref:hypothetical protein n=1 Tax=unclassified Microcoleus TaxID=2642155 RepID=UPI002FD09707
MKAGKLEIGVRSQEPGARRKEQEGRRKEAEEVFLQIGDAPIVPSSLFLIPTDIRYIRYIRYRIRCRTSFPYQIPKRT